MTAALELLYTGDTEPLFYTRSNTRVIRQILPLQLYLGILRAVELAVIKTSEQFVASIRVISSRRYSVTRRSRIFIADSRGRLIKMHFVCNILFLDQS